MTRKIIKVKPIRVGGSFGELFIQIQILTGI
jgi:hypothetical protein